MSFSPLTRGVLAAASVLLQLALVAYLLLISSRTDWWERDAAAADSTIIIVLSVCVVALLASTFLLFRSDFPRALAAVLALTALALLITFVWLKIADHWGEFVKVGCALTSTRPT